MNEVGIGGTALTVDPRHDDLGGVDGLDAAGNANFTIRMQSGRGTGNRSGSDPDPAQHAEAVDHGGVRIGADQRVGGTPAFPHPSTR